MFGFISRAYTAVKEAFKNTGIAIKQSFKSAYTKTRNFFFGAPVEKVVVAPVTINGKNYGALSNFIDPIHIVPLPNKPEAKHGITEQATRPVLLPRVPGPFSPEINRLGGHKLNHMNDTITSQIQEVIKPKPQLKTTTTIPESSKTFIPVVASKDILDSKTLQEVNERSPDGFHTVSEPAPVTTVVSKANDDSIAVTPTIEENTIISTFKTTVAFCDNLGSALDKAIADGEPQQAFNSALKSVGGLLWGAIESTTAKSKSQHTTEGWAADYDDETPRARKNKI